MAKHTSPLPTYIKACKHHNTDHQNEFYFIALLLQSHHLKCIAIPEIVYCYSYMLSTGKTNYVTTIQKLSRRSAMTISWPYTHKRLKLPVMHNCTVDSTKGTN